MHSEVDAWRRLASSFILVPGKERGQEAVIRKKINILAMAMGKMVLHSLALLLLSVCIACAFRNNVVAVTNGPLVEGMSNTETGISSWWTLSSWLASSSLSKIMPRNSLQEGRDKDHETPLASSLSWRTISAWLASLSSSSSMMPNSFLQEAKDKDFDASSSPPPSSSLSNMMPGNSVQEEKDKDFDISLPSSSPSWWWLSSSLASSSLSSSSSAASSAGAGTMHNESKETTFCPPSCFRPNPVCGVDGITYWCGSVDAECAGVEVDYTGFCDFDSKGTGGKGILAIQSLLLVHMVWLMLAAFLVFLGVL